MQIKDHINLLVGNDAFYFPYRLIFGVIHRNIEKLSVHIAINATGTLDDAFKIQVRHYPDLAPGDFIISDQQRGRGKSTRLVTLNATDDQNGGTLHTRL